MLPDDGTVHVNDVHPAFYSPWEELVAHLA